MTMTKTCLLWNEQLRQHETMREALEQQMRDEFPVGTRVRWTHTYDRQDQPVKREGAVVDYSYGPSLMVEMKAHGAKHRVPAHQAEPVEPVVGVSASDQQTEKRT